MTAVAPRHLWRWVLLASCAAGLLPSTSAASRGPDLSQTRVSDPPALLAAGAALEVRDRVRNLGTAPAGPSKTRFYLSTDGERDSSDARMRGRRSVPQLRPGHASAGSTTVHVPVRATLGNFRLIACAGEPPGNHDRHGRNDCLASDARVRVTLPRGCRRNLTRLRVSYRRGPQTPGVADPVIVRPPLSGIGYFAQGATSPRTEMFMDCSLAIALYDMAATLTARGITAVEDLGIYEYRCIAGTDPCVLSEHAHATAIDLHAFRTEDGETYNVETDWIINSDLESTCAATTFGHEDALLHELACEWDATNLFHVILTPNYNADHRNHLHVDLTPGVDFID